MIAEDRLSLLDKNHIYLSSDTVEIVEQSTDGKGTARFVVKDHHLRIKPFKSCQAKWILNRACADGSFVTFDGENAEIHIVELKSSLDARDWMHVRKQFAGMLLNAFAVLGFLKHLNFEKVNCYIAYKEDKIANTASPIYLKPIAKAAGVDISDWLQDTVKLPLDIVASLIKGKREASGDISFEVQ